MTSVESYNFSYFLFFFSNNQELIVVIQIPLVRQVDEKLCIFYRTSGFKSRRAIYSSTVQTFLTFSPELKIDSDRIRLTLAQIRLAESDAMIVSGAICLQDAML